MLYPGLLLVCRRLILHSCFLVAWGNASPGAELAQPSTPDPAPSGRAAAQHLLRSTYRYDPAVRQRYLEEMAAEEDVVHMEQVVVHESKAKLQFNRYIDRQRRREDPNKPSLANGAEVPGIPGLGVKPYHDILPSPVVVNRDAGDVGRFVLFGRTW